MKRILSMLLHLPFMFGDIFDGSSILFDYSKKIPEEKTNYSFFKTKTYYQNPNLTKSRFYHKKTIPRNKYSQISLKGLNIRKENQRKNIQRKFDKQLKERNLERALNR